MMRAHLTWWRRSCRQKVNGQRSGSSVSGMKGLLVIVGAMVGFIGLLAVVATVLTS